VKPFRWNEHRGRAKPTCPGSLGRPVSTFYTYPELTPGPCAGRWARAWRHRPRGRRPRRAAWPAVALHPVRGTRPESPSRRWRRSVRWSTRAPGLRGRVKTARSRLARGVREGARGSAPDPFVMSADGGCSRRSGRMAACGRAANAATAFSSPVRHGNIIQRRPDWPGILTRHCYSQTFFILYRLPALPPPALFSYVR